MALDLSSVAIDLLDSLADSQDYVIIYETGGYEDPITGQWFDGEIKRIQLDAAYEDTTDFSLIDGTTIQAGDVFLLIKPDVSLPSETFWFEVRGSRYNVVQSSEVINGGILQYSEYQLRRS